MSNGEKRRGLWIDPRTKILLLLLCVLSATMAPSLLYEMLVVALVACFGIVCGKVRYSIIGVIVYGGFYLLTQAVLQIEAFTFSPSWTQALESAWLFTQNGCTLEGMVEINDRCKVILSDEHEKRHALMFRVQEG